MLKGKDLLSIHDLSAGEVENILSYAAELNSRTTFLRARRSA